MGISSPLELGKLQLYLKHTECASDLWGLGSLVVLLCDIQVSLKDLNTRPEDWHFKIQKHGLDGRP
jgi:hypothetical protein